MRKTNKKVCKKKIIIQSVFSKDNNSIITKFLNSNCIVM